MSVSVLVRNFVIGVLSSFSLLSIPPGMSQIYLHQIVTHHPEIAGLTFVKIIGSYILVGCLINTKEFHNPECLWTVSLGMSFSAIGTVVFLHFDTVNVFELAVMGAFSLLVGVFKKAQETRISNCSSSEAVDSGDA